MTARDSLHILQDQLRQADREGRALRVCGGGSKAFYGFPTEGDKLSTLSHSGIVSYQPEELVLTARAGTPLAAVEAALAEQGQMLGCEPPHFGKATFGGMIAAGLAGPRRPLGGSVADSVLGCRILNGRGEVLRFGGKVMKNVAGYDLSRLMAGSLGCLGVILEATVKVQPRPRAERTFRFDLGSERVAQFINNLTAMGCPVSASCHDGAGLAVRFSAGEREIAGLEAALRHRFGFLDFEEELLANFWVELREQRSEFFSPGKGNLWRLSLPPGAPAPELEGEVLVEWNGALRWLRSDCPPRQVFERTASLQGSAALFRCRKSGAVESLFQPLPPPLMNWHRQLKNAFDPTGILNAGRMYREL